MEQNLKYILTLAVCAVIGLSLLSQIPSFSSNKTALSFLDTSDQIALINNTEALDPVISPTDLTASILKKRIINLAWTASSGDNGISNSGYAIFLDGREIARTKDTTYQYSQITLPGIQYCFSVKFFLENNFSQALVPAPPCISVVWGTAMQPTNLTATIASPGTVNLAWQYSLSAEQLASTPSYIFIIERSSNDGSTWAIVKTTSYIDFELGGNSRVSIIDTTAPVGVTNSYRVTAFDQSGGDQGGGFSRPSGVAIAQTTQTNSIVCTGYNYSSWGTCNAGTETRAEIGKTPTGCLGSPLEEATTTRSCTIVPAVDNTAPIILSSSPRGILPANTTNQTLSVTTNENAICKYSANPNTSFANMPRTFVTSNQRNHSIALTSIESGNDYIYYVKCRDIAGNTNTTDYQISFIIEFDFSDFQQNDDDFDWSDYSNWYNYQNNNNHIPPPPPSPPNYYTQPLPLIDWSDYQDYDSYNAPTSNSSRRLPVTNRNNARNQTQKTPASLPSVVSKNLKLNDEGPEVILLQKTLNMLGYAISASGPGSMGKETSRFDEKTKEALIKYQKSYVGSGIVPTGTLDNSTLLLLNSDIARLAAQKKVEVSAPADEQADLTVPKPPSRATKVIGSNIDRLVNLLTGLFK